LPFAENKLIIGLRSPAARKTGRWLSSCPAKEYQAPPEIAVLCRYARHRVALGIPDPTCACKGHRRVRLWGGGFSAQSISPSSRLAAAPFSTRPAAQPGRQLALSIPPAHLPEAVAGAAEERMPGVGNLGRFPSEATCPCPRGHPIGRRRPGLPAEAMIS